MSIAETINAQHADRHSRLDAALGTAVARDQSLGGVITLFYFSDGSVLEFDDNSEF